MIETPREHAGSSTVVSATAELPFTAAFNCAQRPYPEGSFVHELFERQALRTPHEVAVVHGTRRISYAALDSKANELARQLRASGVGPDQIVGVCIERGVSMIIALLAILKAGGGYLPLDPTYPQERLQYMIDDAAPVVVLTSPALHGLLRARRLQILAATEEPAKLAPCRSPCSSPGNVDSSPQQLLYVIYTSGSTGRPKGVAMSHAAMVNLLEWHRDRFGSTESARVLQFAALSFDVAFQEIFTTLCTGGTLILLDEWVRRDVRSLVRLLCEERIDRLFVPPMMLQAIAEHHRLTGERPIDLKDVIVAGEQLRISSEVVALFARAPACRLHNHYGPTETHVVTSLTLTPPADAWPALPSIGTPIANCNIHILDAALKPVPVGVVGEIYIGGANLARGYLHRPELTAERFLPDPFASEHDARLYKTGDLGRRQPDGSIDCLGRSDGQVKIRGYRIELGEIEAQLARYEHVREVAVVARERTAGQRYLVAYVTARDAGALYVDRLRGHARAALPEHMVPSAFVVLQQMPLTPSGKLDRRALPEPQPADYGASEYEDPHDAMEAAVAELWQELLGMAHVGRNDHFFELGGDSLATMKLTLKLAERFGVRIEFPALIANLTLQALARLVQATLVKEHAEPSAHGRLEVEQGSI